MTNDGKPSPDLFFDTITAYQKSAALKAALDLGVFTALGQAGGEGALSSADLASKCGAAERGMRILCDFLTIQGFLLKSDGHYRLTLDSAVFLDGKSRAYVGRAADFLMSDELTGAFRELTASVRKGGTAYSKEGTIAPEHPVWISFAQTMGAFMAPASEALAELLKLNENKPSKVLDVAASHGVWGISVARRYPHAQLTALDWAPVLEVARANARAADVESRFRTIAGSAFDVDLGTDYDVILIPNFLHHFNPAECIKFLKKAQRALRTGGRVAIMEFVPNPDRVTPPPAAGFSLVMLASTPEGDAYTVQEYTEMLAQAGFQKPSAHELPASPNQALLATRL